MTLSDYENLKHTDCGPIEPTSTLQTDRKDRFQVLRVVSHNVNVLGVKASTLPYMRGQAAGDVVVMQEVCIPANSYANMVYDGYSGFHEHAKSHQAAGERGLSTFVSNATADAMKPAVFHTSPFCQALKFLVRLPSQRVASLIVVNVYVPHNSGRASKERTKMRSRCFADVTNIMTKARQDQRVKGVIVVGDWNMSGPDLDELADAHLWGLERVEPDEGHETPTRIPWGAGGTPRALDHAMFWQRPAVSKEDGAWRVSVSVKEDWRVDQVDAKIGKYCGSSSTGMVSDHCPVEVKLHWQHVQLAPLQQVWSSELIAEFHTMATKHGNDNGPYPHNQSISSLMHDAEGVYAPVTERLCALAQDEETNVADIAAAFSDVVLALHTKGIATNLLRTQRVVNPPAPHDIDLCERGMELWRAKRAAQQRYEAARAVKSSLSSEEWARVLQERQHSRRAFNEFYHTQLEKRKMAHLGTKIDRMQGVNPTSRAIWTFLKQNIEPSVDSSQFHLPTFLGKDGTPLADGEAVQLLLRALTDPMRRGEGQKSRDRAFWQARFPPASVPPLHDQCDRDISWREIVTSLKDMHNGKSPGINNIPVEVWRLLTLKASEEDDFSSPTSALGKLFFALIKLFWTKQFFPDAALAAKVVALFKQGDKTNVDNYRCIMLIDTATKVVAKVLADRVTSLAEEHNILMPEQAGFRPRQETVAQVLALHEIISRRREHGLLTYAFFLDLRKAYDSVPHEALFAKMESYGFSGKTMGLIRALYRRGPVTMTEPCGNRLWLDTDTGLRQGCPLSPVLFNIFINDFFKDERFDGVAVPGMASILPSRFFSSTSPSPVQDGGRVRGAFFADDGVILAASREALVQNVIPAVVDWCNFNYAEPSPTKCEIMRFEPKAMPPAYWSTIGKPTATPSRSAAGPLGFADGDMVRHERESASRQWHAQRAANACSDLNKDATLAKHVRDALAPHSLPCSTPSSVPTTTPLPHSTAKAQPPALPPVVGELLEPLTATTESVGAKINGTPTLVTLKFKYLGVLLQHDLSFDQHVDRVCAAIDRVCTFALSRLPTEHISLFHRRVFVMGVFVNSVSYAVEVWGPSLSAAKLDKLQAHTVRACRAILRAHRGASSETLLQELGFYNSRNLVTRGVFRVLDKYPQHIKTPIHWLFANPAEFNDYARVGLSSSPYTAPPSSTTFAPTAAADTAIDSVFHLLTSSSQTVRTDTTRKHIRRTRTFPSLQVGDNNSVTPLACASPPALPKSSTPPNGRLTLSKKPLGWGNGPWLRWVLNVNVAAQQIDQLVQGPFARIRWWQHNSASFKLYKQSAALTSLSSKKDMLRILFQDEDERLSKHPRLRSLSVATRRAIFDQLFSYGDGRSGFNSIHFRQALHLERASIMSLSRLEPRVFLGMMFLAQGRACAFPTTRTSFKEARVQARLPWHTCPLCFSSLQNAACSDMTGRVWEWSHLLLECSAPFVIELRALFLLPLLHKTPFITDRDYAYRGPRAVVSAAQGHRFRPCAPAFAWADRSPSPCPRLSHTLHALVVSLPPQHPDLSLPGFYEARAALYALASSKHVRAFERIPKLSATDWNNMFRHRTQPQPRWTRTFPHVLSFLLGGVSFDAHNEREWAEAAGQRPDLEGMHMHVDVRFTPKVAAWPKRAASLPPTDRDEVDVDPRDRIEDPHERTMRRSTCTRVAAFLQCVIPIWRLQLRKLVEAAQAVDTESAQSADETVDPPTAVGVPFDIDGIDDLSGDAGESAKELDARWQRQGTGAFAPLAD